MSLQPIPRPASTALGLLLEGRGERASGKGDKSSLHVQRGEYSKTFRGQKLYPEIYFF